MLFDFYYKTRSGCRTCGRCGSLAVLAGADKSVAQDKTLHERLSGVFAIAAVVDHFSDAIVKNPIVGQSYKNKQLREWHTNNLGRLPGLKFMRTRWVCEISGGPFKFLRPNPVPRHSALSKRTKT